MADPFAARRREAFQSDYMPAWTVDAACRGDKRPDILGGIGRFETGTVWEAAFTDDLTHSKDGKYVWTAELLKVMELCAGCPVRAECLEYGYKGDAPILVSLLMVDDEEAERIGRSYRQEYVGGDAEGVYGGLPGPQRKVFAQHKDRLAASEEWFQAQATRHGWNPAKAATISA